MGIIRLVHREAVVAAGGDDEQIAGGDLDSNPAGVILCADVKVADAVADEADLLVLVDVLLKEGFEASLVVLKLRGAAEDLVAGLVAHLPHETIDFRNLLDGAAGDLHL